MARVRRAKILLVAVLVTIGATGCAGFGHSSPLERISSPPATSVSASSVSASSVSASSVSASSVRSAPLIDHVRWTSTDKGRQLQVFPTPAGRTDSTAQAPARAWAEVLAAAPEADSPGMHDQFLCHWNFARLVDPDKASWNLEPWRAAAGYPATVAAGCNPGGAES
jgi:hypothetical protein